VGSLPQPSVPRRSAPEPRVAVAAASRLGEGPTWDPNTGTLLWVDILSSEIHVLDPATGVDRVLSTGRHVGAAKPRACGGLVANLAQGVAVYDEPAGQGAQLSPPRWLARYEDPDQRGNDAAVDAFGTLWAGVMRYDEAPGGGALRRFGPDGAVLQTVPDLAVSNGIGWSPDGAAMYFIDSPTRRVDRFEVDPADGSAHRRSTLIELPQGTAGFPDGLAVDADGCVWVALWDGWAVHRYTPDGRLDRVLELPVARPTACAFGGPDLADLYITTARVGLSPAALAGQPLAGSLLVLPGAGRGLPAAAFAG
jgi:sugar lactone lactonase YvrE